MDIGQVGGQETQEEEWNNWQWEEEAEENCEMNWVGKGKKGSKGKGKGTKGKGKGCFNCGSMTHWSRECPKGKSKGKGSMKNCYNCGSAEHLVADCPNKGKGKGRIGELNPNWNYQGQWMNSSSYWEPNAEPNGSMNLGGGVD